MAEQDPTITPDAGMGALLGTFVGDALGMPYEGAPSSSIPDALEMVEARRGRGTYTDDTEMMIALAESLVEHGHVIPEELASRFLARCDPSRGYGAGTLAVMAGWRRGRSVDVAAQEIFGGEGSFGNGAAMRVAPVGVRFAGQLDRVAHEARLSAATTHAHPIGIDGAVVQAVAVAVATRGGDVIAATRQAARTPEMQRTLGLASDLLRHRATEPETAGRWLGNSSAAHQSVPTAILAAVGQPDFRRAVTFAIRCGGDTDTIGAMAGAIAGARDGAGAIPASWREALEAGPSGRPLVERLAGQLQEPPGAGQPRLTGSEGSPSQIWRISV